MPSYTNLQVKMQRDSNSIPWGFRMHGGRDYGCPLQIQKVNPNSLAERCGIQSDDYILKIGTVSTEHLQHNEAQEQIKRHPNVLEFVLQRGAPPTSADYNSRLDFAAQQPIQPNFLPQSLYQSPPQSPLPGPQIVMPISNNRTISSQSYNTPIGLYSADNITDTISRTLKSINVDSDYQAEEPPKTANEFKPSSAKSMPKPAPHNNAPRGPPPPPQHQQQQQQQPYSAPYAAPPKPAGGNKPSFNVNVQGTPGSGNRILKKGGKGSALLNQNDNANQVAVCHACGIKIRGPFISAVGHCFCVNHFTCSQCSRDLVDCGFIEENGKLYCEQDFEQFLAPHCAKCSQKILKECVHALEQTWHPECFLCTACKKSIGTGSFHVEEGQPYCTEDYRRMFQAKCTSCEFPIEPGDKYLEALGGTYHVECFNCSSCQTSLDGQPFVVKNNKPYCRQHGRPAASIFNN
ncbi:unnamed protein product [Adineta steineri]|uniref:PDZ and LIM domain protein Zasp n=1 Tax=Adineta steineri TaxID=433720 RepID=A0A814YZA5_9BILA|nr:unnamed protein product [Adineta steineri]CAF3812627.1 unnamed protein product [Adineta steineri]